VSVNQSVSQSITDDDDDDDDDHDDDDDYEDDDDDDDDDEVSACLIDSILVYACNRAKTTTHLWIFDRQGVSCSGNFYGPIIMTA